MADLLGDVRRLAQAIGGEVRGQGDLSCRELSAAVKVLFVCSHE